jgi:hypothetical protein
VSLIDGGVDVVDCELDYLQVHGGEVKVMVRGIDLIIDDYGFL